MCAKSKNYFHETSESSNIMLTPRGQRQEKVDQQNFYTSSLSFLPEDLLKHVKYFCKGVSGTGIVFPITARGQLRGQGKKKTNLNIKYLALYTIHKIYHLFYIC